MVELLELKPRARIFKLILKSPGIYLRELQKTLKMPMGQLEHHLKYLERANLVISKIEEGRRRYFCNEKVASEERKILALLRMRVPRRTLLFLLHRPYSKHSEIRKALGYAGSTITSGLKKLIAKGLVVTSGEGRVKGYRVIEEEKILRLFIIYRASYSNKALTNFLEDWEGGLKRFMAILERK
jgi:predicted transcriptional regulator